MSKKIEKNQYQLAQATTSTCQIVFFRFKNFVELEIWAGPKVRLPSTVSPIGGVSVHCIRQNADNNGGKMSLPLKPLSRSC